MIYNCVNRNIGDSAKHAAMEYLESCNVPSISGVWRQVVDAKFLKVADDGKTGTVRAAMKSPLIVNTILKDAKLLKDDDAGQYLWPHDEDDQYYYKNSYITMDRTFSQQEERRKLVAELKQKIISDPSKRWVIRYSQVVAVGDFINHAQ